MKIIKHGKTHAPSHAGLEGRCMCGCCFQLESEDKPTWRHFTDEDGRMAAYWAFEIKCPECDLKAIVQPEKE